MKNFLIAATVLVSTFNASAFEDVIVDGSKWIITEKSCNGNALPVSGDEFVTANAAQLVIVQRSKTEETSFCNTLQSYRWRKEQYSKIKILYYEMSLLNQDFTRTVCRNSDTKAVITDTGVIAADALAQARSQSMALTTTTGSNNISLRLANSESCPALPLVKNLNDESGPTMKEDDLSGFRIKAVKQEKK